MQALRQNQPTYLQQNEDVQVDSSSCCHPSFRNSKSSHSSENLHNSQQSLKTTKDRGIKLTHKTKSFTSLNSPIKLQSKKSEPLRLNQKMSKKQEESKLSSNAISNIQRCIDYKNKIIKEHKKEENQIAPVSFSPSKQEELFSTRKNTARTMNSSHDLPLLQKTLQNNTNLGSIQPSIINHFKEEKSYIRQERTLLIKPSQKDQRKTLERVFEQTQGKRIVTLQSQFSQDEQNSNDFSVAESYEFPIIS